MRVGCVLFERAPESHAAEAHESVNQRADLHQPVCRSFPPPIVHSVWESYAEHIGQIREHASRQDRCNPDGIRIMTHTHTHTDWHTHTH